MKVRFTKEDLELFVCPVCGMSFLLIKDYLDILKKQGFFYCPKGCKLAFEKGEK
ncbi:MAG: hypothetical protein ACFFBD_27790 [Candidatus Hodarchaeota archaeon]